MLTGLELTFISVTQSYSGIFSTPGFLFAPVGKRGWGQKKKRKEKRKEKKTEGGKKGIEKERKEGIRNKENRMQDKKEF